MSRTGLPAIRIRMLHSDEVVDDPEDILDVWRLRRDNLFVTRELMVVPGSVSPVDGRFD